MKSILLIIACLLISTVAQASSSCPTLRQARAAHPDAHLRWTGDHCWYAPSTRSSRHHRRHHHEPVHARSAPVIPMPVPRPSQAQAPEPVPVVMLQVRPIDVAPVPEPAQVSVVATRWPVPEAPIHQGPVIERHNMATVYLIVFAIVLLSIVAGLFGSDAIDDFRSWRHRRERQGWLR